MDSLQRIRIRLGMSPEDESRDPDIEVRRLDAADFFCRYCRRKTVPAAAEGLVEQLAVWMLQTPGGVQSEKIGDTSVTYRDAALPPDLQQQLNRYRRIGVG